MEVTNEAIESLTTAIRILASAINGKSTDLLAPEGRTPSLLSKQETLEVDSVVKADNLFPEDLSKLLTFTLQGNIVHIKPKNFLGSDRFARIASTVKTAGGEYVSAGKLSHFEIAVEKL